MATEGQLREGILEISPVPIAVLDADRRVVLANDRAKRELGLREDELLGLATTDSALSAVDADGNPVGEDEGITVDILEREEPVYDRVYRVDMPTGESIWLSISGTPLFDDDGEVEHIVLAFEDITERKERERRFDAVFHNTYQFTGLMEPDGTLIEANRAALEFGGVEREAVIGEKVWETPWFQVDEETPEQVREDVQRAREGEFVRYELEVQGATDTAVIDFSLKPITDERGEVTLIVPEGRDITDLKRREEELREERAFTESMLSGLPDVLYAFDKQGNFLRWNERFSEVTGYSDAEIEGMQPLEFVPDDEATKIAENIAAVVESGEVVTVESYLETKEGERIPYEFTGAPLVAQDGTELGLVGMGRDVTDRRERERRFDAVFNNTYQFTGLMEPDGTLIEANDTALEFAGVEREAAVGQHLAESPWITEENREFVYEATERARAGEFVRSEMEINGAEGPAIIDFSLKPVTDDQGEVDLIIPEGRNITERKEREDELREERAFTDSMLGAVPDVFYAYDTDGNFVRWNDRFAEVTGYSDAEIEAMEPLDFVPEEENEPIAGAISSILEDGEPIVIESYFETKEGERVPYEFKAGQWRGPDGEVEGVVGIGRDITARKERQRRFEAIFNQTYQFTGLMEPDGTLIEANDTALEFAGVEREDVVGRHLAETAWITEENREFVYEATERAREGEFVRREMEINGAEGPAIIDFSLKPITDERGNIDLIIPEGRDITERKRRERRFDAVFNNTYQFTGLMEPDGTLIEANDTALEFVGVEREAAVGQHLAESPWIREENREFVYEGVERAREGEFVRREMEINSADGTTPIDFSLKPVTDDDGEVVLIIPEGRDISELKERERELAEKTEQLERTVDRLERTNAELEQFAYVASHDLQEPLRMISSYLDLLEMEYEDRLDAEAQEYIDYAVDGAERMREMIDDLLQFSRVQTRDEEFERQPVDDVVDEALDNLALAIEEADAEITREELPTIPVDAHQLRQLFQNLLENAINYAGEEPPRIHIGATERPGAWELTVADEGVGIPEEEQDRIFDIFMRGAGTEEGGSGIGLAICKRVVENHGGRIDVESEPGEGTTFRFTLSKQPGGSSERGMV